MEILPGIEIRNKALWIKKEKILIIADLHIGYEEALIESGILIPKRMFSEIRRELKKLLELKPEIIIINGDLKHEFGKISKQEWHEVLEILDLLLSNGKKVILIKGNHDNILEPIAKKKNLEVKDYFILKKIALLHGHKIFLECLDKGVKTIIIGHDHPAICLSDGIKSEKFKCFLLGKFKEKNIIVMPSFFTIFEGSDVKKEKLLSPFLKNLNLEKFRIFVIIDKVYDFGFLKNL